VRGGLNSNEKFEAEAMRDILKEKQQTLKLWYYEPAYNCREPIPESKRWTYEEKVTKLGQPLIK
jgi:hypothetical protein